MHELILNTADGSTSWDDPFIDMDKQITQDKGFAIQAPDQYSKWAYPASTYYKNKLSRLEAGHEDLEWTFTGTLEQDVNAPEFKAVGSQWTLMTNTFMGNIDVKNLISEVTKQLGGETQISVWSFNNGNKEGSAYGSFATHNSSSASASGVKIKPQHVFFCYNTNGGEITLPEDICDFKTPTTYKDFTQGVAPSYKPTLEIRSLNGRYSSVTSIVYDAYLEEEQLGSKEFNLMKLFTGYAQTPDICSYYGADALYSQTINPSIKIVPLGVKAGEELKAVFEFSGAEDFKEVYLEDRAFGKRYDLKNTESLEFDLTEGYNQGRFYVIFEFDELDEPTTDLNESAASEIRIYTEDNENVVVSSEGADLVRIQMIDMSGKQQNIKVKSDRYNLINMSSYPAGVYTFKASTTDRTKVEKVVIK
ncbi:MAG: T9SS type A sorting domain-containing protein, partial [Paludibacteraceae bacterium]|nr:T9SS type A sorting domain-containing protein [Paludibacteraceae bacterium]